jgi:hypothetical protein
MKYFGILLLVIVSISTSAQKSRISTEWLFIYYMPYDNNLSNFADTIVTMIRQGLTSTNVVATIQADTKGSGGMTRFIITSDTVITSSVASDLSAHTTTYSDFLAWNAQMINHQRRGIVFLDHGGKLDEVGLDSYPQEKFLRVDSIREVLKDFNRLTKLKTDLLFLQVCTKASIEPLYELRDCAKFTMASQSELGAPNFYYTSFFKALAKAPAMTSYEVAKSIMTHESHDMYNSLTCIDNLAFPGFKKRFNALIERIPAAKLDFLRSEQYVLHYYGQTYYDLVGFLKGLELTNEKHAKMRDEFIAYIKNDLIVWHQVERSKEQMYKAYCGLSLFSISRGYREKTGDYKHIQFFRDFDMNRLYRAVYGD